MRRHGQGNSLGTVVLLVGVALMLLMTAVSGGVFNLRLSVARQAEEQARDLADSAISAAMAEMARTNFSFGSQASHQVVVDLPGVSGAQGLVTFAVSNPYRSTYNFNNSNSRDLGGGISVPAYSARLVGQGRYGSARCQVECFVARPPFPDALVSNGPVVAEGVQVAGVRDRLAYTGGPPVNIPAAERLSGNLCSNFSGPGPGIDLRGPDSLVTGNLVSQGTVSVGTGCLVEGAVDQQAEPRRLPAIDVASRINTLKPSAIPLAPPVTDLILPPDWFAYHDGDLTVSGDVQLSHSVLLVDGDLTVTGALSGNGAILVNGTVDVGKGSTVVSDNQVALAAVGDITLAAPTSRETNYISGLLYSQGSLDVRKVTMMGVMIGAGTGGVTVQDARAIGTASPLTEYMAPLVSFGTWSNPNPPLNTTKVAWQVAVRKRVVNNQEVFDLIGHAVKDDTIWDTQDKNLANWQSKPSYRTATRLGVPKSQLNQLWFGLINGNTAAFTDMMSLATTGGWMVEGITYYTYLSSVTGGTSNGANFNLNKLLADNLSEMRVLLWRRIP